MIIMAMFSYFTIEIAQQKVSANKPGLANKVFETKLISAVVWGNRLDSFLGAQMSQNMAANITIWPNTTELYIGGTFYSSEYNYISMSIKRWKGQSYCKSTSQINDAMTKLSLGFGVTEYYFDSSDYSNPIKLNVNTVNQFGLIPSFKKTVRLMFRK